MGRQKGYFITFEGIDGSGKSTMLKRLAAHIKAEGYEVCSTFEPGSSPLGQNLRQILLNEPELKPSAHAEALLFAADRAMHVEQMIRPALEQGQIVLCDRYTDSTLAYQGGGRGLDMVFLAKLNNFAAGGLKPDLTLFFDLPLNIARSRQNDVKDKMEQEQEDFFQRIIASYQSLAAQEPQRIQVINATLDEESVFKSLLRQWQALRGLGDD